MLHGEPVYVVVPARDESPRIDRVLRRMPTFVDRIIVIDDGSTDSTAAIARIELGARGVVVRHASPCGVGAAIARGYELAASYTLRPRAAIAVMAGDDQMHPDDLEAVVTPVVRGDAGYVKGNRFAWPGGARGMPLARRVGSALFAAGTSLACRRRIHDSQCGYTAVARRAVLRLDLANFWPSYGYPNVLLAEFSRLGETIAEVPVRAVYADEVSRLRLRHVVTIGRLVLQEAFTTHARGLRHRPLLEGRSAAE